MRRLCGLILSLAAATASAAEPELASERAALLANHVCRQCHGPGGNAEQSALPKLAAQHEDYLIEQIRAFRGRREEPEGHQPMLGMSVALDDDVIEALARYVAGQPPARGVAGDRGRIRNGRALYESGDGKRGVPACALCHGDGAEGIRLVPRLAGQNAVYLMRQLRRIRDGERDSPIMHEAIGPLTDRQIRALASFLQSR